MVSSIKIQNPKKGYEGNSRSILVEAPGEPFALELPAYLKTVVALILKRKLRYIYLTHCIALYLILSFLPFLLRYNINIIRADILFINGTVSYNHIHYGNLPLKQTIYFVDGHRYGYTNDMAKNRNKRIFLLI